MFDPFFLPSLILGPAALIYLLRRELRRDEESLRPDGPGILLGVLAAFGLRQWILVAGLAFDDALSKLAQDDVRSYALWIALLLVALSYVVAASLRRKRVRGR